MPIWSGELYLEYHRVTYTSMAKNKQYNRCSEFLLQNLEMLGIYAGNYSKEQLNRAWNVVLRNQFYDILPGSSIEEVYKDSWKEYSAMTFCVQEEMGKACSRIEEKYQMPEGSITVYNFNGVEGNGLVSINAEEWERVNPFIKEMIHQVSENQKVLLLVKRILARGFVNFAEAKEYDSVNQMLQFSAQCVENEYYKVVFNEKGQFASFYDKRIGREILKSGMCGNVLMTYEDKPFQYDNWNFEHYYTEKSWEVDDLLEAVIVEERPLRYSLWLVYQYLGSKIIETLHFYPDSNRIQHRLGTVSEYAFRNIGSFEIFSAYIGKYRLRHTTHKNILAEVIHYFAMQCGNQWSL